MLGTACGVRLPGESVPSLGDLDDVRAVSGELLLLDCDVPLMWWSKPAESRGLEVTSLDGTFRLRLGGFTGVDDNLSRFAEVTMTNLVESGGRYVVTLRADRGSLHMPSGRGQAHRLLSATVLDRTTGRQTTCSGDNFDLTFRLGSSGYQARAAAGSMRYATGFQRGRVSARFSKNSCRPTACV
jgi:hypothetical protein